MCDYSTVSPKLVPSSTNSSFAQQVSAQLSREGGCADRGLSNSNKVQKVQKVFLKNSETGENLELDKKELRLSRMRKRVFSWASTIADYLPEVGHGRNFRKIMITLTYEKIDDWHPNHIRDYIKELRRRLAASLVAYAWCAELQQRGAVHYHIEVIALKGTKIPMPDKSGMWVWGSSRIETAKSVFYIVTYLKKAYQKMGEFPKGLRIFSVWISPGAISSLALWYFRTSSLPNWFRTKILQITEKIGSKWERAIGGGWFFGSQFFKSPFVFVGFG